MRGERKTHGQPILATDKPVKRKEEIDLQILSDRKLVLNLGSLAPYAHCGL